MFSTKAIPIIGPLLNSAQTLIAVGIAFAVGLAAAWSIQHARYEGTWLSQGRVAIAEAAAAQGVVDDARVRTLEAQIAINEGLLAAAKAEADRQRDLRETAEADLDTLETQQRKALDDALNTLPPATPDDVCSCGVDQSLLDGMRRQNAATGQ